MILMEAGEKNQKNRWQKFSIALVLCLLARLFPFRAPNIEPILATMMPIGRAYGALMGFSFAVLSILLYDIISGTAGIQTFFTLVAYGALGLWSGIYFSAKGGSASGGKTSAIYYVKFAIMGTLFFDAMTGLTVGPLVFNQPFMSAVSGQIPFTLLHLVGNTAFAFVLSPAIYDSLIKQRDKIPIASINNISNPNPTSQIQ